MKTAAVTTRALDGESYREFQLRTAADAARAKAKCDALDEHVPRCTACGETCDLADAGTLCKVNNMPMTSRWAQARGSREFYALGHFGGSWHCEERSLAVLLDRVWAEAKRST